MTALARAVRQGGHYALFQILGLLVSLVSFPVLTRILSVEEYGHLALFTATSAALIALSKCGVTTSFVRNFAGASVEAHAALYTTALVTVLGVSLGYALALSLGLRLLDNAIDPLLHAILWLAGPFLVASALREMLQGFLRAEERSLALSLIGLAVRIGSLVLGIVGCVALSYGLRGFVGGTIAAELVGVGLLLASFARRGLLQPAAISQRLALALLSYGAPVMLYEVSWLVNQYAGRFVLNSDLGAATVGVFSVGYNLAAYVLTVITAPMNLAIFPIYTKLWETEGAAATSAFLATILRYYVAGATVIIAAMSATKEDLIAFLATPRFAAGAQVVPLVITSVMLFGTTLITSAGFHLLRKTREFGLLMLVCAALNIAANVVLIPWYGMMGAACATLLSYTALSVLISLRARTLLAVPWPLGLVAKCAVAGTLAYAVATQVAVRNPLGGLLLRGGLAVLLCVAVLLAADRRLREGVRHLVPWIARGHRPAA